MNFVEKLYTGIQPPEDINVVIEISKGSNIKYELNLDNGLLYVDRILSVEMVYPFNYGFIPQTIENLDDDFKNIDNLDAFVIRDRFFATIERYQLYSNWYHFY